MPFHFSSDQLIAIGSVRKRRSLAGCVYIQSLFHLITGESKLLIDLDLSGLKSKIESSCERLKNHYEQSKITKKIRSDNDGKDIEFNFKVTERQRELFDIPNVILSGSKFFKDHFRWDDLKNYDAYSKPSPIKPMFGKPNVLPYENDKSYDELMNEYEQDLAEWKNGKDFFEEEQNEINLRIDTFKKSYTQLHGDYVQRYCDLVIDSLKFSNLFPTYFDLDYKAQNKQLVIDYDLPTIQDCEFWTIPRSMDAGAHVCYPNEIPGIFSDICRSIVLRVLYEVFLADSANAVERIIFNGFVEVENSYNGGFDRLCVISIEVTRNQVLSIDLKSRDRQICFKRIDLDSVFFENIVAVSPIERALKPDRRFVDRQESSTPSIGIENLIAMKWKSFEHLIIDLIKSEFSKPRLLVRLMRSEQDSCVEVSVIDPDPIKGGKIIIHALRPVNSIDDRNVSNFLRTILNEGASKGIFITTSSYNPEAYANARGKPVVLLNGANILHLLEKHGKSIRNDLSEV